MKRSVTVGVILSSLVLVGVLSAQYVLQPSGRVFQAGVPLSPAQSFAPHPRNIVHFDTRDLANGDDFISIVPSGVTEIYAVPIDKYLVITKLESTGTFGTLVEDAGGALSARWPIDGIDGPVTYFNEWPIGLVFSPGSSVSYKSHNNTPTATFRFIGHLADA